MISVLAFPQNLAMLVNLSSSRNISEAKRFAVGSFVLLPSATRWRPFRYYPLETRQVYAGLA